MPLFQWSCLEGPLALICVCLPAIFSLTKRVIDKGPRALFTRKDLPQKDWLWSRTRNRSSSSHRNTNQNTARFPASNPDRVWKSSTSASVGSTTPLHENFAHRIKPDTDDGISLDALGHLNGPKLPDDGLIALP